MFKKAALTVIVLLSFSLAACGSEPNTNQEADMDNDNRESLSGIITNLEQGADGLQVALDTGDAQYSVTISFIKAEIFGRTDQIIEGAEIEVFGTILEGMEPLLIVADQVKVLGSEAEYVMNLEGTVTRIEQGKDGITAAVETSDGAVYQAVISMVTTEIIYVDPADEILEGAELILTGELMDLDGQYIAVDTVVVNPGTPVD